MPFNLEPEIHFTLQNEKHRIPISRDFLNLKFLKVTWSLLSLHCKRHNTTYLGFFLAWYGAMFQDTRYQISDNSRRHIDSAYMNGQMSTIKTSYIIIRKKIVYAQHWLHQNKYAVKHDSQWKENQLDTGRSDRSWRYDNSLCRVRKLDFVSHVLASLNVSFSAREPLLATISWLLKR